MLTYSAVKSVVRKRMRLVPAPSCTRISHCGLRNARCARFTSKGQLAPPRHTRWSSMKMFTLFGFIGTPERPIAARIRPQLGSDPAQAVFTSGECAIARAISSASSDRRACSIESSMTCFTPSPSVTICSAKRFGKHRRGPAGMARERCPGRDRSHRWRPTRRCHSSMCRRRLKFG